MRAPPLPTLLREFHDTSPDAVMVLEPVPAADGGVRDFRRLYLNPAAERVRGGAVRVGGARVVLEGNRVRIVDEGSGGLDLLRAAGTA